jgi:hypothetical protein
MSRGPGRVQRAICEALQDARTDEPWPVWMTVYGLAQRVFEVEYVTRAQVEGVRRACKASEAIEYWYAHLNVPTRHSLTGSAQRWIGKARLVPDPAEAVIAEAWFGAPPIVTGAHREIDWRTWQAPVDAPYYRKPRRDALADALAWQLVRRSVNVDQADIVALFNAYAPNQPFRLDDYAAPCHICGTLTIGVSSGLTKVPDCGGHLRPLPTCVVCGDTADLAYGERGICRQCCLEGSEVVA